MQSPIAQDFIDLVGAQTMLDGKATRLSGAVARGRTLILRLRKPVSDFPVRLRRCAWCQHGFPVDPEGVKVPYRAPPLTTSPTSSSDERIVLERNPSTEATEHTM